MNREVKQTILQRIANGTLSREETVKRLRALVDEELDKPADEMNTELIQECTRLLQEMYGGKAVEYNSRMARSGERIRENLLAKAGKRERRIQTWRTAASIAAVLVLMVVLPHAGYGTWKLFHKSDLTTHNAYVLTGLSGAGTFPNPSKIDPSTNAFIQTDSYAEIVEFLGYEPYDPTSLLTEWNPVEYCATVNEIGIQIHIGYRHQYEDERMMSYEATYCFFADDVYSSLQFNGQEKTEYIREFEIVYMQNLDKNVCLWDHNNIVYRVGSNISEERLRKHVYDIIGGMKSW